MTESKKHSGSINVFYSPDSEDWRGWRLSTATPESGRPLKIDMRMFDNMEMKQDHFRLNTAV